MMVIDGYTKLYIMRIKIMDMLHFRNIYILIKIRELYCIFSDVNRGE